MFQSSHSVMVTQFPVSLANRFSSRFLFPLRFFVYSLIVYSSYSLTFSITLYSQLLSQSLLTHNDPNAHNYHSPVHHSFLIPESLLVNLRLIQSLPTWLHPLWFTHTFSHNLILSQSLLHSQKIVIQFNIHTLKIRK